MILDHINLGNYFKQVSKAYVYLVNFEGSVQYAVIPKCINQVNHSMCKTTCDVSGDKVFHGWNTLLQILCPPNSSSSGMLLY